MATYKLTIEINWYETEKLDVLGYYTEPEDGSLDMIDPPQPSEWQTVSIKYKGINVENILNPLQHLEIEEIVIQTIEDRI